MEAFKTPEYLNAVRILNERGFEGCYEWLNKIPQRVTSKKYVQPREEKQAWRDAWKLFLGEWKQIKREEKLYN
jgi:hypothetical protein